MSDASGNFTGNYRAHQFALSSVAYGVSVANEIDVLVPANAAQGAVQI